MPHAFASNVIDAPIDLVWARIRDFNSLPNWHPAIADSRIEDGLPPDRIGCVRNFNLKGGGNIRERLLALSDLDRRCSYSILESPTGVTNYVATLNLLPVTAGNRTYAQWSADFECEPQRAQELVHLFGEAVFQGGLTALKDLFGQG